MVSSVTTTDFSSEIGFNKFPYLLVKVSEARNLDSFSENCSQFTPYVKISTGSRSYSTSAKNVSNAVHWDETFEISGDSQKPLKCCLMDRDEFGGDIMLAGIAIPRELIKQFIEETTLWIKLEQDLNCTDSFEESQIIKPFCNEIKVEDPDHCSEPIICLKLTYYGLECLKEYNAEITEYESAVKNNELFTQYTVTITRRDGFSWKIKFRYSQLDNIRKILVLQFPELKKLYFPGKTFSLFNLVSLKSQFNEELLQKRKVYMENFLNYVLKYRYHEKSQEFSEFLNMPAEIK